MLDTWVLVEKYEGNPTAEKALRKVEKPLISIITLAELIAAIARREARRGREDWEEEALKHYVIITSGFTVIEITEGVAKRAGILRTKYREAGIEFSLADGIILATAESLDGMIITGGKQYEREWRTVTEVKVETIERFAEHC